MTNAWSANQIVQWPTEKLTPYARNSRTHSDAQVAQIAASIAEFGFTNPILAGGDGVIVAGHGRLAAAQKLGIAMVPVVVLDHLTPTQRRALVIADNRLALDAGWDEEMLARELAALQEDDGFDLSLLGFSDQELAELLAGIEGTSEGLTEEDQVPEVTENPISQAGDVWLLDKHRLMCGDSTSIDAVKKLMAGGQADMLLCDPPYNVCYGGAGGNAANKNKVDGGKRNTQSILNDDMSDVDFRQFLVAAFTTATTVMKPGAVFYIWHSDTEGYNFRGACRDAGLTVRQCLIWKKSSLVMGRQDYHWKHEPCLYGWKDGAGHLWATDRKQTTILEFDKPSANGVHPTMKPVALFEYQMLNNTKGADVVLDLFGGSGTTAIAAEKHGRHARLMELDAKYCDVIVLRWQEFTGQQAIRESDGMAFDQAASSSSTISQ
jgi:DNA modification methylase